MKHVSISVARRARRVALMTATVLAAVVTPVLGASAATTPPLFRISPTSFDFGYLPVGSVATQQIVTVVNVSGRPQLMSGAGGGAGVFGGSQDCQGLTVAAGASCHMYYQYTPTTQGATTGSTGGNWNGQSFSFSFKGYGLPQFKISPTAMDFGAVNLGSSGVQQTVTITNKANRPVVMSGAGGAAGAFGGSQDCQGLTVAAGASCHMYYQYTPTALGAATGSTGGSWNGQNFAFSFRGIGIPRLRISPLSFDFGNVKVGTTSPQQSVTVTNLGANPVTMNGAGGGAGIFGGSQNCQGSTLTQGQSCQMFYAFHPTVAGAQTGSTTVTWNGQSASFSFTGTGV